MTKCTFSLAWIGPCGKHDCKDHSNLVCSCCGAPATRQCEETFGMVCGSPLCNDCEHELTEDGVNVANTSHVKKGEQKHLPWYTQETESN